MSKPKKNLIRKLGTQEKKPQVSQLIADIHAKLDAIEAHLIWTIRPEQRFRIGQRVAFSRRAHKIGFPARKRSEKGVVRGIDGFSVVVQLDGQKQRRSYHHAFFNAVSGPKLF